MAIQTFVSGQVLTAAQVTAVQSNQYNQTVSTKTASYVLVAADVGTRVVMNSASSTTITVNTSLFSAGDTLRIHNIGAGACTITAGTTTVNSSTGSLVVRQYDSGELYFTSAAVAIFFPSQQSSVTFATETTRDAALTSPTQGMHCYITTPAETKNGYGTGRGTQGAIEQVYNGTKWVTITPITSYALVSGGASFIQVSNTTFASLGAVTAQGVPEVISMETGTKCLVTISTAIQSLGAGLEAYTTVAINGVVYSANIGEHSRQSLSSGGDLNMSTFQRPVTVTAGVNTFTVFVALSAAVNVRYAATCITVQALA